MTPEAIDKRTPHGVSDVDRNSFLYLCGFIHEGYYNISITWGEVRRLLAFAVSSDTHDVCDVLQAEGYIGGHEESDPFMILKRIDAAIDSKTETRLISQLLGIIRNVPLAYSVALAVHLQRSLLMGIISSFYDQELEFASTSEERVLVSAITSNAFSTSKTVSGMIEGEISGIREESRNLEKYTEHAWFNELLLIIKNGYYGNGSFNYIDTLERSYRVEFTSGILELIRNGDLVWLILNFRDFVKKEPVDRRIKKFVSKSRDERRINRMYDWLSIANDFAIGSEFLIGSVEFLPHYNPTLGVYLFIVGSAQLLIRPFISLGRKIHLRALLRRRIRF